MQELQISPRYVVDAQGQRTEVILKLVDFERMLEALEDLQDIRDYDDAKATAQEFISLEELKERMKGA